MVHILTKLLFFTSNKSIQLRISEKFDAFPPNSQHFFSLGNISHPHFIATISWAREFLLEVILEWNCFDPEMFFRLFPHFGIHIGRGGCFSWIEPNWGYLEERAPRSCYHHKRRFNADEIFPSRLLFACNRFALTSSQLRECKQNNIEINNFAKSDLHSTQ